MLGLALLAALGPAAAQDPAPQPRHCGEPIPGGYDNWTASERGAWAYEHCSDGECWLPPEVSTAWSDDEKRAWLASECPMILEYCDELPAPDAWEGAVAHDHAIMDPWIQRHCRLGLVHGEHGHDPPPPGDAPAAPAENAPAPPPESPTAAPGANASAPALQVSPAPSTPSAAPTPAAVELRAQEDEGGDARTPGAGSLAAAALLAALARARRRAR